MPAEITHFPGADGHKATRDEATGKNICRGGIISCIRNAFDLEDLTRIPPGFSNVIPKVSFANNTGTWRT